MCFVISSTLALCGVKLNLNGMLLLLFLAFQLDKSWSLQIKKRLSSTREIKP